MDRNSIFGGNPFAVVLRLVVLSIIVGVVLTALDITPRDLFWRLNVLARRIYDMGFDAIEWGLQYFLLGAVIVFPIWFLARIFGLFGGRDRDPRT